MGEVAGCGAPGELRLIAPGEVLACVGAYLDAAGGSVPSAVQDSLQLRRSQPAQGGALIDRPHHIGPTGSEEGLGVGAAVKVDAFGLEPVALVLVVVEGGGQGQGVARRPLVAGDDLLMLGLDVVQGGQTVAAEGVGGKIGVR